MCPAFPALVFPARKWRGLRAVGQCTDCTAAAFKALGVAAKEWHFMRPTDVLRQRRVLTGWRGGAAGQDASLAR